MGLARPEDFTECGSDSGSRSLHDLLLKGSDLEALSEACLTLKLHGSTSRRVPVRVSDCHAGEGGGRQGGSGGGSGGSGFGTQRTMKLYLPALLRRHRA
eukprot:3496196-Rhodomonas_salina.1